MQCILHEMERFLAVRLTCSGPATAFGATLRGLCCDLLSRTCAQGATIILSCSYSWRKDSPSIRSTSGYYSNQYFCLFVVSG